MSTAVRTTFFYPNFLPSDPTRFLVSTAATSPPPQFECTHLWHSHPSQW